MTAEGRVQRTVSVADWFKRRSYDRSQFEDLASLSRRKRELGVSIAVVLPCREVANTVGPIVDTVRAVNERAPLVDEVIAIDAGSTDGTAKVAARHGATVYFEDELMSDFGPAIGKGDAMWRALSVARADLLLYLDADTIDFEPPFVHALLGPLLTDPGVRFVKAAYARQGMNGGGEGGRVTELTAKPLLNLFYPELAGFAQPLAGELAGWRDLFCSIPFLTGYAVEAAMLIDVLETVGFEAMSQVDVGARVNRSQSISALGKMSYAVARGIESRLLRDGRLGPQAGNADRPGGDPDGYLRAAHSGRALTLERHLVEVLERPPMADVL
jgi:glucosyl-3-phosphoglycerate synthase